MSDQKPNVGFSMAQWEKTTVEERDKTTETAFLDPLTQKDHSSTRGPLPGAISGLTDTVTVW